jgi:CubicO group peptidase (beta-lactamase class C family)
VREQLTMRHLLAHTSGIDGDHFLDLGRGEDVLERYVGTCGDLAQVLPLGAAWAYCNTGYAIAGRVLERVTGQVFDAALTERLFDRLSLTHSCLLPEDALRHRVAFGHVPGPDGLTLAPVPITPRTMAPAGGVMASAADVLAFVRLFLDGGRTPGGDRLLSDASIREAWRGQVEVPDPSMGELWGLGWMLTDWDGKRVVGHDGGTVGQGGFVRVLPDDGVALVLLGNGPSVGELMYDAFGELAETLCGVRPRAPYEPTRVLTADASEAEPVEWFGSYERVNMRISVTDGPQGPAVEVAIGGLAAESLGADRFTGRLAQAADGTYLTDAVGDWMPLVPFRLPDGSACLHFGGRAQLRTNQPDDVAQEAR